MKTKPIIGIILIVVAIITIFYICGYTMEQSKYCRHLRDYTNSRPEFFGNCSDCLCTRGASEDCSTKEQRIDNYYKDGVSENSPMHRTNPWYITLPYDQFDITYYGDKIFNL